MENERTSGNSFERLFLDSRPRLYSLVSRYLKRPQDVEDILQETFLRSYGVWLKERIDHPENYLFRTARNLSLKHLSLHSNSVTDYIEDLQLSEVLKSGDTVLSQLEGSEKFALFCEATRELPGQCRKVFILKKVYGLSHDEIAERLEISVSTANKHLAKALARLTQYMRDHGYLENGNGQ